MSTLIPTCPECSKIHETHIDAVSTRCPHCGHEYRLWDDGAIADDPDVDYGGAFDGHTVTSDADPGL